MGGLRQQGAEYHLRIAIIWKITRRIAFGPGQSDALETA
jgi:hypothetical protein